jgi:hypothetical protein
MPSFRKGSGPVRAVVARGQPVSSRAMAITRDRPSLSGSRCDPGSRPDSRATADRAFADHSSSAVRWWPLGQVGSIAEPPHVHIDVVQLGEDFGQSESLRACDA